MKKYRITLQQIMDFEVSDDTPKKEIIKALKEYPPFSSFASAGDYFIKGETRNSVKVLEIKYMGIKSEDEKPDDDELE